MTATTSTNLSVDELKQLAASPEETQSQLGNVLLALASADEEVRAWASDCLAQIECVSSDGANAVKQYCKHAAAPVASWACKLLAKCQPSAPEFERLICEAMDNHESIAVRAEAAGALGRLEQLSPQTRQLLEKAAENEDARLSRLASRALDR
ncbi:MAG: hypothetical protein Aurels2KO_08800 [Aureliella sp.]